MQHSLNISRNYVVMWPDPLNNIQNYKAKSALSPTLYIIKLFCWFCKINKCFISFLPMKSAASIPCCACRLSLLFIHKSVCLLVLATGCCKHFLGNLIWPIKLQSCNHKKSNWSHSLTLQFLPKLWKVHKATWMHN